MKRHKWEEERRLWGGSSLSSHTRIWCFWLQDRQCCQGVRSRIRAEGESGKEEGRRLAFQGEQGLQLGVIQQSRFGGRLGKPLAAAKVWNPPPPLSFLNVSMCEAGGGYCDGIWCQTSKPFYSLHEPPGKILNWPVSWVSGLAFQPVFIPRISYSTLNETEIVRCCQFYLNM